MAQRTRLWNRRSFLILEAQSPLLLLRRLPLGTAVAVLLLLFFSSSFPILSLYDITIISLQQYNQRYTEKQKVFFALFRYAPVLSPFSQGSVNFLGSRWICYKNSRAGTNDVTELEQHRLHLRTRGVTAVGTRGVENNCCLKPSIS